MTMQDNAVVDDTEETDSQISSDVDQTVLDNETHDDVTVDEMNDESSDESLDMEVSDDDTASNLNTGDTSGQQSAVGNPGYACTKDGDCNDWAGTENNNDQLAICLLPNEGYTVEKAKDNLKTFV